MPLRWIIRSILLGLPAGTNSAPQTGVVALQGLGDQSDLKQDLLLLINRLRQINN